MEFPLLKDLIVIAILSIFVLLFCHRLKIPSIAGLLITGVLCGPHGLKLVSQITEVEHLAEIGVVLLLFSVGLEFSLSRIWKFKRFFLFGGGLQVLSTILIGGTAALSIGRPLGESIFLGSLLSLSSTAIVLRVYQEREEMNTPHGKLCLGTLIFQDLMVVPMMLLIPALAGKDFSIGLPLLYAFGKGILVVVAVIAMGVWIIPKFLYLVTKTQIHELFILSILAICFSVAWTTAGLGLSLSLGAFLAGLTISESEYKHRAVGDIIPMQDLFSSLFFVSIGMLLDLNFVFTHPFIIPTLTIAVFFLKWSIMTLITLLLGMPLRVAVITGIALFQIGEFSFVLIKEGISEGIGTPYLFQLFLSVSILTLMVTPTLINNANILASWILKLPFSEKIKSGMKSLKEFQIKSPNNHALIIGYGFCGKNLARSCREAEVPYLSIDMDLDTVHKEQKLGIPILFGDATHESVLKHANIKEAKVVAVLTNDFLSMLRIVEHCRTLNPNIHIIVRTRYIDEMKIALDIGADDAIPDELGASVEVFIHVLQQLHISSEKIDKLVNDSRNEGYERLLKLYQKH